MEICRKKLKNAIKNIEVALIRMEELYPLEFDQINTLKEVRIQVGWVIQEIDHKTKINA